MQFLVQMLILLHSHSSYMDYIYHVYSILENKKDCVEYFVNLFFIFTCILLPTSSLDI